MKKIIILPLAIILFISQSSAQTKDDYLLKSKKQKSAAWALLIGGGVVGLVDAIIAYQGVSYIANGQVGDGLDKFGASEIVSIIGLTAMAGSIPFFIASANNKHKAMSITFSPQATPALVQHITGRTFIPSISLRLRL